MRSHENIAMMTYSEVLEVSGYVGNFKVKIKKKPRYVDEDKCTGCGVCSDKCPAKISNEFDVGMGIRKAIYTPFPQAVPNIPVIDREHCTFFIKGKCKACEKFCEAKAIDFEQKERIIEVEVGSIIVTTGFDSLEPIPMTEFGYGRYPDVYTGIQFERMSNASGPTNGKIVLKDGSTPKSVAILHCIGSRDKKYHEYCSRVCCMYSLKFSHIIREKIPEAEIYQMYIDLRCFGKGYEEFYNRLQEEGINFIRGRAGEVTDVAEKTDEKGKLIVLCEDTLAGKQRRIPVDMVILSTAIEPRADAGETAKLFSLSRSADGFLLEKHPKLDPVATNTDGIFIAGCCQGPKDIPDTVAQAAAAAARVLSVISKGVVEMEAATAFVDEQYCSGCKTCIDLCPYQSISFIEDKKVASINEALCKGCGTCGAACPAGAIVSKHFTTEQILAQVEGVLI
ncbi:MAG TPA: CoB--CoM heterodisulfide reductase iron-sulfur subunit A family protein [Dehalococcoidia bacterium]|nr:CoB--CoM heterodisulfide reductase iron-sulfur subunit A family protein [Dehalococcoidia bacterium]